MVTRGLWAQLRSWAEPKARHGGQGWVPQWEVRDRHLGMGASWRHFLGTLESASKSGSCLTLQPVIRAPPVTMSAGLCMDALSLP